MICAYCGKETKGTKEHIISSGILGLFPECFATIDGERSVVHQGDPMVKDVCADCNNNRISYIDSYAKKFIEKYFLVKYKKDDTLSIEYEYVMIQKMCLKFAFNDLRARKKDVSFFDDGVKAFLLNEERNTPMRNITLLAGLAVNTSPAPDYMFGNMKLRWGDSPLLLSNSIVANIDYNTGHISLRDENEKQEFENYVLSYVFRFNSLQLLMLCWDRDIKEDVLKKNDVILKYQYPYSILDASGNTMLSRCTSEATYHHEQLVDVTWGQGLMDEISYMRGTFSKQSEKYFEEVQKRWDEEERKLAADILDKISGGLNMTLSAKRLGEICGLTAEEMNVLLKEEGFLSGEPGNYYPTEKGKLFVVEKGDDNGYGGYAFRGWNWLEWDERILEEIDTSMERKCYIKEKTSEERRRRRAEKAAESEAYWNKVNSQKENPMRETPTEPNDSSAGKIVLGVLALVGYGAYRVITHFTKKK